MTLWTVCCYTNMYRQHVCWREPECPSWTYLSINTNWYANTVHLQTHTVYIWVHSQQTQSTQHLLSFQQSLSMCFLLSPEFYLLEGWARRLGLILSYLLEPVPWGQLSANTLQPFSIYYTRSYTLSYTIPTYKPAQQKHTKNQPSLPWTALNKQRQIKINSKVTQMVEENISYTNRHYLSFRLHFI